jgi:hypothetical protein
MNEQNNKLGTGMYSVHPLSIPIMGYCGPMGYGIVNQVGRWLELWDIRGYGL